MYAKMFDEAGGEGHSYDRGRQQTPGPLLLAAKKPAAGAEYSSSIRFPLLSNPETSRL